MADYSTKNFCVNTLPWKADGGPREYVYGLCSHKYNLPSDSDLTPDGFRRTPFYKPLQVTANGDPFDIYPITANTAIRNAGKTRHIHPVVDPSWGFGAFGMNISGEPTVTDFHQFPTVIFDWKDPIDKYIITGASNAIAWAETDSDGDKHPAFMPSAVRSEHIAGPLYSSMSGHFHKYNTNGIIDTELVVSDGNNFGYYLVDRDFNNDILNGRTGVLRHPTFFAVVATCNCDVIAGGVIRGHSDYDLAGTYSPYLRDYTAAGSGRDIRIEYKVSSGWAKEPPSLVKNTGSSQNIVTRIKQVYQPWGHTDLLRFFFIWVEPPWPEPVEPGVEGISYISLPPIIYLKPKSDMHYSANFWAKIIQWGMEFNF
jgi:hypothetical protein